MMPDCSSQAARKRQRKQTRGAATPREFPLVTRRAQDSQVINCCCGWDRNPDVHNHIICFANHQQTVQRKSRTRQLEVLTSRTHVHGCHSKSVFELAVRQSQHRLCGGEHAEPRDHHHSIQQGHDELLELQGHAVIRGGHHQRNPLQVARHSHPQATTPPR